MIAHLHAGTHSSTAEALSWLLCDHPSYSHNLAVWGFRSQSFNSETLMEGVDVAELTTADSFDTATWNLFPSTSASILLVTILRSSLIMYVFFFSYSSLEVTFQIAFVDDSEGNEVMNCLCRAVYWCLSFIFCSYAIYKGIVVSNEHCKWLAGVQKVAVATVFFMVHDREGCTSWKSNMHYGQWDKHLMGLGVQNALYRVRSPYSVSSLSIYPWNVFQFSKISLDYVVDPVSVKCKMYSWETFLVHSCKNIFFYLQTEKNLNFTATYK
jgi:hypothetical protein